MLFDAHNHSQFSFDGKRTTIYDSALSAFEKGLAGICFTDHCDIYVPQEVKEDESAAYQEFDIKTQQAEINHISTKFPDTFKITKGIEVGLNGNCRAGLAEVLRNNSFDQVIASVHYLEDSDPYYGGYFTGKDCREAYGTYLETLFREMTALGDFDIAGHYDYVARYAPYPENGIFYRNFSDVFDSIFRYLIENGKGLEVNTKSRFGSRGRRTALDTDVLLRYRELGGEIISLGSDSHDAVYVGDNFAENALLLKSPGFRWTSHYEKRQLVQLPL